ncbi:hypothetical protein IKE67_05800 [bacterium]|nr:hypothetical protein [bacterium]
MINIIDTFRNVAGDKYAIIKIFILTIPTLLCVYAKLSGNTVFYNSLNLIFGVVFAAVFFETIRRSCNAEPMLLPSFLMPIRMFITLGLTILAAIPIFAVCIGLSIGYFYVLTNYFSDVQQSPIVLKIINSIYALIISSLFFSSVTQFLDTGKIWDAYNPIKVMTALKTFIVNTAFFIVQNILFILIMVVLPAYVIVILAGMQMTNFFVILWLSMCAVLNYLMWADFYGQTKKESEVY